jgi:Berberine and berberine like
MFGVGIAPTPDAAAAVDFDCAKSALERWELPRTYFNFAERKVPAERLYPAETYRRLRRTRAAYDPGELFVANHRIPV